MTAPSSCSSQRGIFRQGFPQQETLSPPSNQASLVFLSKPVRRCACVCVCVCVLEGGVSAHGPPVWVQVLFHHGALSALGGATRPWQLAQSRSTRWAQSPSELEGGPFTSPRLASLLTDGETEAQRGKRRDSPQSSSPRPRPEALAPSLGRKESG